MRNKMLAVLVILSLAVGFIPIVAAELDDVPWARMLDEDFQIMAKPEKPGKPPAEDPPQPAEVIPWGVNKIDADLVWGSYDGTGINIAVLDTGIDKDHPDLDVMGGRNFVPTGRKVDVNKWDDDNGHGTHVAGTIAALHNDIGVKGVAPDVNLYAYKVLDRTGSGSIYWIADAIKYATDNDIHIISMSLGASSDYNNVLRDACNYAYVNGVVIVAAAGNEAGSVNYPAVLDSVIAVSATTSSDTFATFSNYGAQVELAAPGVEILSTYKDGGYAVGSGTSMSTPHVAGAAALVWEMTPSLTNAQVRTILQVSSLDLGDDDRDAYFGYGRVDANVATGGTRA
ncbi:MAG: S8 family peptidase [Thermoplasmatota archaeon]